MALLFMDSFDHYATADLLKKWTQTIPVTFEAPATIAATGRHSSNGAQWLTGSSIYAGSVIAKILQSASGNTVVAGFGFRHVGAFSYLQTGLRFELTSYNFANILLAIRQGGTPQFWLRVDASGTISVLRGELSSTVLGTTTRSLTIGVYAFIEVKVVIDSTSGTVDVRVNGEPWLVLTGQNTQLTTSPSWNEIIIGGMRTHTANTVTWHYDDLYVLDGSGSAPWNAFLGDCRVDPRYPTAEGVSSAWTPLSGTNNALMVDETAPDDDTTYNSTTTVGATDTYVVDDAPSPGSALYGVQMCISSKKADAGPCSLAPVIRLSGGSDVPGTAFNPGTAYNYQLAPYSTQPGGSTAWTEAAFNAAEFGVKRTV